MSLAKRTSERRFHKRQLYVLFSSTELTTKGPECASGRGIVAQTEGAIWRRKGEKEEQADETFPLVLHWQHLNAHRAPTKP